MPESQRQGIKTRRSSLASLGFAPSAFITQGARRVAAACTPPTRRTAGTLQQRSAALQLAPSLKAHTLSGGCSRGLPAAEIPSLPSLSATSKLDRRMFLDALVQNLFRVWTDHGTPLRLRQFWSLRHPPVFALRASKW